MKYTYLLTGHAPKKQPGPATKQMRIEYETVNECSGPGWTEPSMHRAVVYVNGKRYAETAWFSDHNRNALDNLALHMRQRTLADIRYCQKAHAIEKQVRIRYKSPRYVGNGYY